MMDKEYFYLKSMRKYLLYLRGMTNTELVKEFPNTFPKFSGTPSEYVTHHLTIDAILWRLVGEYAKFLSKHQKLGMFVPCDIDGNNVFEPEYFHLYSDCILYRWDDYRFEDFFDDEQDYNHWKYECQEYQKAKELCLFEGFVYENDTKTVYNESAQCRIFTNLMDSLLIEDLLNSSNGNIQFTPKTLKQLGLI